ncbi:MAG: hypothetical protein H6686_08570 [Fibrobacteria bacterium]|nr:hypothetical protein [Fibrobacteria bacterium]
MMIALGVILIVSALGVTSLTLASKDVGLSGSTLDVKTSEEAALGGLREVLGRMEAHPVGTVAQLQNFVNDTSTSNPRQWFIPSGDSMLLVANEPSDITLGGTTNTWKARLLGINLGGAQGTTSDRGVELSIVVDGKGRNGSRRRVVGTYRMRGLSVPTNVTAPGTTDTYALYINGSMGSTTLAINITGDVYVGGSNHLRASTSITINGGLRTSGDYKTSAPVTVSGKSYIGGCLDPEASGTMTFGSDLGVGNGICNAAAPIFVNGNFNLYGTQMKGWNAGNNLTVGGQFYVRDMLWDIKSKTIVGGSAYYPKSFNTPSTGMTIGGNLEVASASAANLAGPFRVGGTAAFRNTGGVNSTGITTIGGDAYFASLLNPTGDSLGIGGSAWMARSLSNIPSILSIGNKPGITVGGDVRVDAPSTALARMEGYLQAGGEFTHNGLIADNFGKVEDLVKAKGGKPAIPYPQWIAHEWSYQKPSCFTDFLPRVSGVTRADNIPYSTGNCRTTSLDVLTTLAPIQTPKGLALPAGNNMGYTVHDTLVDLLDNLPDTILLAGPVESHMKDLSDILPAMGITTKNLTGEDYNDLFEYFSTHGLLYNGYMVLRIDENISMDATVGGLEPFKGKALLVVDAAISTNATSGGWPPSRDTSNLQVIFLRNNGSLGNSFGIPKNSPYAFWGYIHYEDQWSGNHAWNPNSEMYGSIYMAGANSSVTGSPSELTLERRESVFQDIGKNLNIIFPNGSVSSGGVSTSSRKLVLTETWVQFDLISLAR